MEPDASDQVESNRVAESDPMKRSAGSARDHPPNSAEPDKKERVEILTTLSKAASDRFTSRRSYEWQISLALWTAFGASLGFLFHSRNGHQ